MYGQQIHEEILTLVIREVPIKIIVRYHFTSVRMAGTKRQEITSMGDDLEKKESSYTIDRNANWCSHCVK